jgi:GTP-binding protein
MEHEPELSQQPEFDVEPMQPPELAGLYPARRLRVLEDAAPSPTPPDTAAQSIEDRIPVVAIVGRPNVGKSSLFNRILNRRQAIVTDVAGTTRDRLMAEAWWDDYQFILVDTGGLETRPEGTIQTKVQEQADMAVGDADVVIFLTDGSEGITSTDSLAADRLRRTQKPVLLAVNKVDNETREFAASEFFQLGLDAPLPISAYHNLGIYQLMDRVCSHFTPTFPDDEEEDLGAPVTPQAEELKLAIVGRTNVGKSMLLNSILGHERSIVTPEAGTTRDALDTYVNYNGQDVVLIDTAGIRRPGRVQRGIEKFSVMRSVNAVQRSDITLLITDASELATAQDSHIAGLAWEMCRGLIVVVNKWDLASDGSRRAQDRAASIVREKLHFMPYVPVCFTSALHQQGIARLMGTALELRQERSRFIPARELQYVLADALADHTPPTMKRHRRERLRINRLRQVGTNPPTFLFTVDNPNLVHFSYERYLENRIRSNFGFDHTHLKLVFRRR